MKARLVFIIIGLLTFNLTIGQNLDTYKVLVDEAWGFYKLKKYQKSADKYKEAFDILEGKAYPNDRYNAACSYAMSENIEVAFYHLFRLANDSKYKNYNHITTDKDLNLLYNNKQWNELILKVKLNKDEYEKDLDMPLVNMLDSIFKEDQDYRMQLSEIEEKYGRGSDEIREQWDMINLKDSINLIKIVRILDEKGWLGSDIIGDQGNSTLFLVIQHADIDTQVKYLPMMREAVKNENARGSSLALLEDRVSMRQGNRQIYGSQISRDQVSGEFYVAPLIDPENVDERRAKVGLGSIADYVKNWDMTWDVEKHKERATKIVAERKD